ncbi:MAG: branched-chain amino acid transport system substrate-binding protein [Solirubrobacteraceae bacterium]|nr:branched-chain amino acid transport system substrate-binding protein [Solirubrobacteraceae bacterium]
MRRNLVVVAALVAAAFVVAACGSTGSSSSGGGSDGGNTKNVQTAQDGKFAKPIVIAAAMGVTGLQAPFDNPPWNGVKFAIDDINKAGGINGQKLTTMTEDTKSTVPGARKATLGLLGRGAQLTFQTCNYDFGVSGGTAASNAGIIAWSLCAASPKWGVQGIGQTAYTSGVVTYAEGNVDAKFGSEKLGKKAFALCDTWIDYGIQTCQGFKDAAKSYGIDLVGTANVNTNKNPNISAQLTKIRSSGADFIYWAAAPPGAISSLKQIRGAGIKLPIVMPTASYGLFWKAALPHLNNVYMHGPAQVYGNKPGETNGGGDPRPEVNALVKRYIDQFGKNPDHGNFLEGYASMQILAQAIKATGTTDGKKLSAWIDKHGQFDTVLGPKVFTPQLHSDPKREFVFVKYVNTWPEYAGTMSPSTPVDLHLGS